MNGWSACLVLVVSFAGIGTAVLATLRAVIAHG